MGRRAGIPMSQHPMNQDIREAPAGILVAQRDIFTPAELDAIIAYGDGLTPMKAGIAERNDNTDHLRITRVAWIERSPPIEWLHSRIEKAVLDLNTQLYKYDLYGLEEAFQYTVYEGAEGGHYNWHVDTGKTVRRKISLTLQLSEPSAYEGGELLLDAGEGAFTANKARGTLVAFPSYVMHRVSPVRSGVRKSLVVWVAGPPFR
jgi:PKHD-type hydroxylase